MTKGTELSAAIVEKLQSIRQANGFSTDVKAVYGFGERKPDKAPLPYMLLRIAEDVIVDINGEATIREAQYEIQGVMARSASLIELQLLHYDIHKALGTGKLPNTRPLKPGWPYEESAEFLPDQEGSSDRSLISSITIRYIETY